MSVSSPGTTTPWCSLGSNHTVFMQSPCQIQRAHRSRMGALAQVAVTAHIKMEKPANDTAVGQKLEVGREPEKQCRRDGSQSELPMQITNAAMVPGIQPNKVKIATMAMLPSPLSRTASGGRIKQRMTRMHPITELLYQSVEQV